MVTQSLNAARIQQFNNNTRKAREIYLELLKLIDEDSKKVDAFSHARQACFYQLAVISLHAKKYEVASKVCTKAIQVTKQLQQTAPTQAGLYFTRPAGYNHHLTVTQLYSLLGRIEFADGNFDEAAAAFELGLKGVQEYMGSVPKGKIDPSIVERASDLQVWTARAYYHGGSSDSEGRGKAIALLEALLKSKSGGSHVPLLLQYTLVATDCGKGKLTMPYLLRALVRIQEFSSLPVFQDDYVRRVAATSNNNYLTDVADRRKVLNDMVRDVSDTFATVVSAFGVATLMQELHGAATSAAALAFLGQTLKDNGAVREALDLYSRAAAARREVDPDKVANLFLNLIHLTEIVFEFNNALSWMQTFCKENLKVCVNGSPVVASFYDVIKGIKDVHCADLKSGTFKDAPAYTPPIAIADAGYCQVKIPGAPQEATDAVGAVTSTPYSSEEENVLALMFTMVKILFVSGALQVIPALIKIIEPLRAKRDLHLSKIRNEHAYYSCVAQLMPLVPFPVSTSSSSSSSSTSSSSSPLSSPVQEDGVEPVPIYVCGDSHCLSPAWQSVIDEKGQRRLLKPLLVTGLKCWYLRPECKFYPKRQFEEALRHIPEKSTVVFIFGEIDCREGILLAVEKCKYESIEQGIDKAVSVYVETLKKIAKARNLNVYVHPVNPVLDVTRTMVLKFNAALHAIVTTAPRPAPAVAKSEDGGKANGTANAAPTSITTLKWLPVADALLLPDGTGFDKDKYGLDGTHMSPKYVHLWEKRL